MDDAEYNDIIDDGHFEPLLSIEQFRSVMRVKSYPVLRPVKTTSRERYENVL